MTVFGISSLHLTLKSVLQHSQRAALVGLFLACDIFLRGLTKIKHFSNPLLIESVLQPERVKAGSQEVVRQRWMQVGQAGTGSASQ